MAGIIFGGGQRTAVATETRRPGRVQQRRMYRRVGWGAMERMDRSMIDDRRRSRAVSGGGSWVSNWARCRYWESLLVGIAATVKGRRAGAGPKMAATKTIKRSANCISPRKGNNAHFLWSIYIPYIDP